MRRCLGLVSHPTVASLGRKAAPTTSSFAVSVRHQTDGTVAASEIPPLSAASASAQQPSAEAAAADRQAPGATAMAAMERAAAARREIFDLWRTVSAAEEANKADDVARLAAVGKILDRYKVDAATPREEDVSRGLGDALDRLLLLCVPLPAASGTEQLERILQATGRLGRRLSVRTVQHLFARTGTFAEALAIFYALRRSHFAMSMESYHAMLYSLQRLEEEGWAMRFHDEVVENGGTVSAQALDFVLRGVDNQLMPENKPWLGRVMFAEQDSAALVRQRRQDYDALGKAWIERYKGGGALPHV